MKVSLKWLLDKIVGLIAQLVENRTGIAEVMGSIPIEVQIFFCGPFINNCLDCYNFTAMIIIPYANFSLS